LRDDIVERGLHPLGDARGRSHRAQAPAGAHGAPRAALHPSAGRAAGEGGGRERAGDDYARGLGAQGASTSSVVT
jgi:hypothetical protein